MYGSPEVSGKKQAEAYFGRQSASPMKKFLTLGSLLMTVSKTIIVKTIPFSNIGLTHRL